MCLEHPITKTKSDSGYGYKVYHKYNGHYHSVFGLGIVGEAHKVLSAEDKKPWRDTADINIGFHVLTNLDEARVLRERMSYRDVRGGQAVIVRVSYTNAEYQGFFEIIEFKKVSVVVAKQMTILEEVES